MPKSYSSLKEDLICTAEDKAYRHAYAEESLNFTIATQIKVLREQREPPTQELLAKEAGMRQSMISRYENVNYSSWSINTLRKLANAFDVYLDVRFRSFRDLVESTDRFSRDALQVPAFTEDPYFKEQQSLARQAQNQPALANVLFLPSRNVGGELGGPLILTATESAASTALGPRPHRTSTAWNYST